MAKGLFRSILRVFNIFDVKSPILSGQNVISETNENSKIVLSQFSKSELQKMTVSDKTKGFNEHEIIGNMVSHIKTISSQRSTVKKRLKDLSYLSPEISQLKMIYVSSIMSPTDMQTDAINVQVDTGNSTLDTSLSTFLNDYFNDEFQFGVKLKEWLDKSLFDEGAAPVMIVPRSEIRALDLLTDKGVGLESFNCFTNSKDLSFTKEFSDDLEKDAILDISFESLEIEDADSMQKASKCTKALVQGSLEFIKDNLDSLSFVSNPFRIQDSKKSLDKSRDLLKKMESQVLGFGESKIFSLNGTADVIEGDHPFVLELDSALTVPVCVPGSTREHIGYFVLTDDLDNVLSSSMMGSVNDSPSGLSNDNYRALYGNGYQNKSIFSDFSGIEKKKAAKAVFALTIKKLLKEQLGSLDLGEGITLHQYDGLSKCLFYNMLHGIKTKIVFVPEPLMMYYAFEFNDDGTGKSLLEDIEFLLALRTTLIISNVLTTMKNAVDETIIEVDVNKKNINIEETLQTYKNIAVMKNTPRFNTNPYTSTQNIIGLATKVFPKNMKGLEGSLSVEKTHRNSNIAQAEPGLLERLTKMAIIHIGVPPSAINEMGQNEYSRSIATTDLHFSNVIRVRQRQVAPINNKFIRNYVKYSFPLREKIKAILDDADVKVPEGTEKEEVALEDVIRNIKVTLPTCNVATNKSKYTEVNEIVGTLDTIFDALYPNDSIPVDDQKLKNTLTSVKMLMKTKNLKKVIKDIGYHKMFELPELESIDSSDLTDLTQYLINLSKGVNDRVKVLNGDSEGSSGGGW